MHLRSYRLLSQVIFLFLSIIGIAGVAVTGLIFPYFFCNASPGAVCVCPLWVLEHAAILSVIDFKEALAMFLYLLGFLGIVGFFVGRTFCGWACPIGFIQDIANYFKGKIKVPFNILIGLFMAGWVMFGTIFMFPNVVTGYLGITGVAIIVLALYGLLISFDQLFLNITVSFLALIGLILIRIYFWDQSGLREILFFVGLVILFIGLLSLLRKFIYSQTYIKDSKFYHQNKYYLIKYVILILIPITSVAFMDKWFTNIDPIGGLTAGVPVLMYESGKWQVSNLLWIKFILIALFFWIILISYHGFCRFICPVGALMAPTNKISLENVKYFPENCTKCMKCVKSCPMRINILKMNRDYECLRCGRCVDVCKDDAVHLVMANKIIK